jgi:hypothetical protein
MLLMACGLLVLVVLPAIRKKREAVFQESKCRPRPTAVAPDGL